MTISAEIAEQVVGDAVRRALADAEGQASVADSARQAERELQQAQTNLDAALRSFMATGLTDEPTAVERLEELRQARDDAQTRLYRIGPATALSVNVSEDWEHLSLDARRALIRTVSANRAIEASPKHSSRECLAGGESDRERDAVLDRRRIRARVQAGSLPCNDIGADCSTTYARSSG